MAAQQCNVFNATVGAGFWALEFPELDKNQLC